ncbi:aldolase [Polynucleobacter brandtiae]|uniref:Ribulose-5-phosphate 4-epimerase/fuculose-1-phosphate aldolase n=1 Tax=Polynucleobacter brandtiae TaxID=1938816 RepID=A0A2M8VQZ8_9BURK|nr:aldolase [Polynucleobacter brandtiae]PJI79867.1 ribulose-5-phosphate 4-epimerase/fuculose-1-phosphate aldolase [Polynucleobacter brandtiae]
MTESILRDEICRVGLSLYQRGYAHATVGNISVRLPENDGYLITPTDACLGSMDPNTLAKVDMNGAQISGDKASKTLNLHRSIYAADPTAHCVIHSHCTHLVALTLSGVWSPDNIVPPITPYYVMKVGHVPLIPYHRPGDPKVGELIALKVKEMQAKNTPIQAVMLERLGPNVWHHSLSKASAVLEELEETARLYLMTKPSLLTDIQIQELRDQFDAKW